MAPQNKQMPLEDVIIISGHYWPLNTPAPLSYAASLDQINMHLFYWVVSGVCTWLFSAMPSSVEQMFRDASEVKRGTSKQFIYEKQSVNARIVLGERVMQRTTWVLAGGQAQLPQPGGVTVVVPAHTLRTAALARMTRGDGQTSRHQSLNPFESFRRLCRCR